MAAGEAGTKVKSRQGGRLPNASESQILRELALIFIIFRIFVLAICICYNMIPSPTV
jgi:hypothetical protein